MAPEIEAGAALTKREPYHGWAADMWAFGAMTYELLEGKPAFRGASVQQLNMRIVRASHEAFTAATPPPARGLIKRLLILDATHRLPAKGCLAHPWFAPIRRAEGGTAPPPPPPLEADSQYEQPVLHGRFPEDRPARRQSEPPPTQQQQQQQQQRHSHGHGGMMGGGVEALDGGLYSHLMGREPVEMS